MAIVKMSSEERAALLEGGRALLRYSFGLIAWGLVTGVAITKSCLSTKQAIGMTLIVYGGSAQLAALPLMAEGAPLWLVLSTAAVVNLRFVIFSAGIQPFFGHLRLVPRMLLGYLNGDLTYLLFTAKYPRPSTDRTCLAYFVGLCSMNWLGWQIGSLMGIALAAWIPDAWGLGFAGTLVLIAVVVPMLTHRSSALAAAAAAGVAIAAVSLPLRLNIALAVVVAVLVGMAVERASRCAPAAEVQS